MEQYKNITNEALAAFILQAELGKEYYIHGSADPDDGECYGLMRLNAFDSELVLAGYIGGGHSGLATVGHMADSEEALECVRQMLDTLCRDAGFSDGLFVEDPQAFVLHS